MLFPQDLRIIGERLQKLGFRSLRDYYASSGWIRLKIERRKAKRKRYCQCCWEHRLLELHHVTYERLGEEADEDVLWVCDECHEQIHLMYKAMTQPWHPGLLREATELWSSLCWKPEKSREQELWKAPPSEFLHVARKKKKRKKTPAAEWHRVWERHGKKGVMLPVAIVERPRGHWRS